MRTGTGIALTLAAATLGVLITGCASSDSPDRGQSITASLDRFDEGRTTRSGATGSDNLHDIFEENAALLPSLVRGEIPNQIGRQPIEPIQGDAPPVRTNIGRSLEVTPFELDLPSVGDRLMADEGGASSLSLDEYEPETAQQVRDRLIAEAAGLLQREIGATEAPLTTFLALAALDSVAPGALGDPAGFRMLSPRERDLVSMWRDLHRSAAGPSGDSGAADHGERLIEAVEKAAERVREWRTVRIVRSELCTRVDGFGVFNPLPGPKMLAGRPHRMIVYIELEDFSSQPSSSESGTPGFLVELGQELNLFHDADGLLAWRKPEEVVKDFSRNKRRDFYMVQLIELPETLTVGKYRLKATIRDRATGAVSEAILPIEIVADAALVRGQQGRN